MSAERVAIVVLPRGLVLMVGIWIGIDPIGVNRHARGIGEEPRCYW
jgi:hypothetical protein